MDNFLTNIDKQRLPRRVKHEILTSTLERLLSNSSRRVKHALNDLRQDMWIINPHCTHIVFKGHTYSFNIQNDIMPRIKCTVTSDYKPAVKYVALLDDHEKWKGKLRAFIMRCLNMCTTAGDVYYLLPTEIHKHLPAALDEIRFTHGDTVLTPPHKSKPFMENDKGYKHVEQFLLLDMLHQGKF